MAEKYDIVLDGQLGQRFGTLAWTEKGDQVSGIFSLLGFDNPVRGKREGTKLELVHELRTAVSTLLCRTAAELQDDVLCGVVSSEQGRLYFHGRKSKERAAIQK